MNIAKEEAQLREISLGPDQSFELRQLLAEAEAIQELATRVTDGGANVEDFDMLRNANRVTFRLLVQARDLVGPQA